MPASNGSAQMREIGAKCRALGDGRLKRDLSADIRLAVAPLESAVRRAAIAKLPKRNGLNYWVADAEIKVRTTYGAATAGARMSMKPLSTNQTDSGYVRHPTFGRRGKGEWQQQSIPGAAGWWSKTLKTRSAVVVHERIDALIAAKSAELEAI